MSEARLERTRRAYDRVIDMRPHGCRIVDVGTQDTRRLNGIWDRSICRSEPFWPLGPTDEQVRAALGWNVIEGEDDGA